MTLPITGNPKANKKYVLISLLFFLAFATFFPYHTGYTSDASDVKDPYTYEDKAIKFRVRLRTPEQMAAFYEGRGFPDNAIKATTEACFITAGMRNLSDRKIWLDLKDWRFYSGHGQIKRIDRQQWIQKWQQLNVPLANQSTFGWTLLPEARDLHPDEPVGGNITFLPIDYPFTIEANFKTGPDGNGKPISIKIHNVKCEKNATN